VPFGGVKRKVAAGKRGLRVPRAKADHRALAERVLHFHAHQASRAEAELRLLEGGVVGLLRREQQPLQAIGTAAFADLVLAVELGGIDQHRQRAALLFRALVAHRHLLEVRIVDPHLVAVGDDQLRRGLEVFPAELPRRRQLHACRCWLGARPSDRRRAARSGRPGPSGRW
jgi:hypothetical protein